MIRKATQSMFAVSDSVGSALDVASPRPRPEDSHGFSRLELVAVLAALGLLVLVALPVLGTTRPRSRSVTCANNLSRIGQAFTTWASEHGDHYPWEVGSGFPDDVSVDGTKGGSFAWLHFYALANHLSTPKVL